MVLQFPDTETEGLLPFIIKFVLTFFFSCYKLEKEFFFLPAFVKIGKMDGRLRNYMYFKVQNTID